MRNTQGKSEQYREVVREDTIIIKGKAKAPDYSFRIGRGQRVFFGEAKKPSVNIRNKGLDVFNLNLAVQKIIDRILFLRIAEDKHMEEYRKLRKICDSAVIYNTLDNYFQKANDKYNSGLFEKQDWLCELQVDNN